MNPAFSHLLSLIDQYGYLMLLVLSILEGPILCVLAGFILAQGELSILPVFAIMVFGDIIGDLFWYTVGYYGARHPWANKWMAKNAERVEKFKERYRQNLGRTLMIVKYTQTGIIAMPAAGAARMPLGLFVFYNTLASIPKTALLMMAGYFFGFALHGINLALRIGSVILGVGTIAVLIIYYQRYKRNEAVANVLAGTPDPTSSGSL